MGCLVCTEGGGDKTWTVTKTHWVPGPVLGSVYLWSLIQPPSDPVRLVTWEGHESQDVGHGASQVTRLGRWLSGGLTLVRLSCSGMLAGVSRHASPTCLPSLLAFHFQAVNSH